MKLLKFSDLRKKVLIAVIPAPGQNASKLGIESYEIEKYDNRTLEISLKFKNPEFISMKI